MTALAEREMLVDLPMHVRVKLCINLLADNKEVLIVGSAAMAKATKIGRTAFERCIVKAN